MKIFVIGLNGLSPDSLLTDERLENFRRLMEIGCYGMLALQGHSARNDAWTSLGTGSIPFQRQFDSDRKTEPLIPVPIWDLVALNGKSSLVISNEIPFPASPKSGAWVTLTGDRDSGHTHQIFPGQQPDILDRVNQFLHSWDLPEAGSNYTGDMPFDFTEHILKSQEWDFLQVILDIAELLKYCPVHAMDQSDSTQTVGEALNRFDWVDGVISRLFEYLTDETVLLITALGLSLTDGGSFILAAANNPRIGLVDRAQWIDLAPTLLDLAGYWIPESMHGQSLVKGMEKLIPGSSGLGQEDIDILRERLSGLGYIE